MSFDHESQVPSGATGDVNELGLCFTCISVKTCTGRKTWMGPVVHCEEFQDMNGGLRKAPVTFEPATVDNPPSAAIPANARAGLCVNCAHHGGCRFPVVEGGTWHCEEYE